jgi:hypothetical protein
MNILAQIACKALSVIFQQAMLTFYLSREVVIAFAARNINSTVTALRLDE